tara:strand:+ start:815 stop:1087 length:273 start_codon:yes stop_codon:yes gene_type:complete
MLIKNPINKAITKKTANEKRLNSKEILKRLPVYIDVAIKKSINIMHEGLALIIESRNFVKVLLISIFLRKFSLNLVAALIKNLSDLIKFF